MHALWWHKATMDRLRALALALGEPFVLWPSLGS